MFIIYKPKKLIIIEVPIIPVCTYLYTVFKLCFSCRIISFYRSSYWKADLVYYVERLSSIQFLDNRKGRSVSDGSGFEGMEGTRTADVEKTPLEHFIITNKFLRRTSSIVPGFCNKWNNLLVLFVRLTIFRFVINSRSFCVYVRDIPYIPIYVLYIGHL